MLDVSKICFWLNIINNILQIVALAETYSKTFKFGDLKYWESMLWSTVINWPLTPDASEEPVHSVDDQLESGVGLSFLTKITLWAGNMTSHTDPPQKKQCFYSNKLMTKLQILHHAVSSPTFHTSNPPSPPTPTIPFLQSTLSTFFVPSHALNVAIAPFMLLKSHTRTIPS